MTAPTLKPNDIYTLRAKLLERRGIGWMVALLDAPYLIGGREVPALIPDQKLAVVLLL